MKKIITLVVLLCSVVLTHAQKKKDLLLEIDALKAKLDSTTNVLSESQRNEKASKIKATSLEERISELKNTNSSLLSSLSTFTEASKKKSENVNKTLVSLQQKEAQLKVINDALTEGDSIKLALLTLFKNNLGDGAAIALNNATVTIQIPNGFLFGDTDKNYTVDEKAKGLLERLAKILNENPDINITVEGNSNAQEFKNKVFTDNWDLSALQAASVVRMLQQDYSVDPKRIDLTSKSEYGIGGFSIDTYTRIIVHPKFDQFYALVRQHMKN